MIKSAAIIKDGIIYAGLRHDLILNAVPKGILRFGIQGFVDQDGKFLNREEAAIEAYRCGQIKVPKQVLYSEDYCYNNKEEIYVKREKDVRSGDPLPEESPV